MDLITEFEGTEGVTRENFNKRIQEANEHISNTNNPHQTTAEQVGAVAKISATYPNISDEENPDEYVWLPYKVNEHNFCGVACDADGALTIVTPKGDNTTHNVYKFNVGPFGGISVNGKSVSDGGTASDTTSISSATTFVEGGTTPPSTLSEGKLWGGY